MTVELADLVARRLSRSLAAVAAGVAEFDVEDADGVHEVRLALRDARSTLRTFATFCEPDWADDLQAELSWLDDRIGSLRDLDVIGPRLRDGLERLPDSDDAAGRRLLERFELERIEAVEALAAALQTERLTALHDALVAGAAAPSLVDAALDEAGSDPRPPLARIVRKRWRALRKAVRTLDEDRSDEAFHLVRIKAKRCRAAADAAVPAWGRDAERFRDAIARLLGELGAHHDTAITEQWLRTASARTPSVRFVAGALTGLERAERDRRAERFDAVWKKVSKRRLRRWLRN